MAPRPFRFGVQAFAATSATAWSDLARRAEAAGYSTLLVSDHVYYPQLAPIPAMMAAAAVTERLRVGTLVLANDFRHPALLASELATVDVLSGGRVEIGIGAGWAIDDYQGLGLPYDAPGVRVARLAEAIEVIKRCFTGEPFSCEGSHYRLIGHVGAPSPVQRPHPPILVGGGGPRMLALAAATADIVGINGVLTGRPSAAMMASMAAASVTDRLAVLRSEAGDRMAGIELNVNVYFQGFGDRDALASRFAKGMGIAPTDVLEMPYALVGTPDEMIADLLARRDRWGFSYIVIQEEHLDAFAPVVAALSGS